MAGDFQLVNTTNTSSSMFPELSMYLIRMQIRIKPGALDGLAPSAGAQDVTFYYMILANGTGNDNGDQPYNGNVTISQAQVATALPNVMKCLSYL